MQPKRLIKFRVWWEGLDWGSYYKDLKEFYKGERVPCYLSKETPPERVQLEVELKKKHHKSEMFYPKSFGSSGNTIGWTNEHYLDIGCISEEDNTKNSSTIMQFTGLLDKRGVEIYEGDIISLYDNKLKVIWNNSNSCFSLFLDESCVLFPLNEAAARNAEILGNILEGTGANRS